MEITEIRIHLMNEERLKAFASVTFNNCFVVRNMKVVQGNKGVFLCMPSRKLPDGSHKDMVHPITQQFRKYLEDEVLTAYNKELERSSTNGQREQVL
jgi:stage V sporulation protein G